MKNPLVLVSNLNKMLSVKGLPAEVYQYMWEAAKTIVEMHDENKALKGKISLIRKEVKANIKRINKTL